MKENIVRDKSFAFALRVVRLCQHLNAERKEFVSARHRGTAEIADCNHQDNTGQGMTAVRSQLSTFNYPL